MNKRLQTLLLSAFAPGLAYLQTGDLKSFYKTISLFFGVFILGVALKLFVSFWGLSVIIALLIAIYVFTAIHSTIKAKQPDSKIQISGLLKFCFTIVFLLIAGLSFANRRAVLGFDILDMNVPVMQPTVLPGERFLVDTWAYKDRLPKRGDIVAHSFDGQQGIYLNRIIAIENDKIAIKNGRVFLNGQILIESYLSSANVTKAQSRDMKTFVVPTGHYFVMGDNRDASFGDSRFSGTITIDNFIGKVTDIISSQRKSRIGITLK